MHYFDELGASIRCEWEQTDRNELAFSDIATTALMRSRPSDYVSAAAITDWFVRAQPLPAQVALAASVGQPQVTVFRDDEFCIEALFRHSAATPIHQHAFSGAFAVLAGFSVETCYAFKERHRFGDSVRVGELSLAGVDVLGAGDVRSIVPGSRLIHSVFHMNTPNVTIVARTLRDERARSGHWYVWPCLSYDPTAIDEVSERRVRLVQSLALVEDERYASAALAAMGDSTPSGAVRLLELEAVRGLGTDSTPSSDSRLFGTLLERASERHGIHFAALAPAFRGLRTAPGAARQSAAAAVCRR